MSVILWSEGEPSAVAVRLLAEPAQPCSARFQAELREFLLANLNERYRRRTCRAARPVPGLPRRVRLLIARAVEARVDQDSAIADRYLAKATALVDRRGDLAEGVDGIAWAGRRGRGPGAVSHHRRPPGHPATPWVRKHP